MFRNKEIRQVALLFMMITIVAVVMGFFLHPAAGILVFMTAVSYGAAFFFFTKTRYERIAQIAEQIDLVLHNEHRLYISEEQEGELSILQSEISKMTLRIREQNDTLQKEKKHLADSLADIAHQLRTPLTSVNLILSLLEKEPDEKEGKNLLREMEELLVRMDWLITSLLKLSRLDAGVIVFQKQKLDVKSLIHAALKPLLIPMELHNITVTETIANTEIYGDLEWLSEAVRNILKNCMESAGDNALIEIACEDTVLFTEIAIRDNGKGIAEEDLPCLFDRFYQGKNSGTAGYGIGLALCKMIITKQGGSITAKNHPQGGAIFIIRFPK